MKIGQMMSKKLFRDPSRRPSARALWTSVLAALLIVVPGCGSDGGTSGSGGGRLDITGTLKSSGQTPLSGISVAVVVDNGPVAHISLVTSSVALANKSNDVTDGNGQFFLQLDTRPQTVALQFQGATFENSYVIQNIPSTAASVAVELVLNDETEEFEEQNEQFEDDEGNEIPGHSEEAERH